MTAQPAYKPKVKPGGKGAVLVVSGPSGSGKSTIIQKCLQLGEFPLEFSVSATSRQPRPGELDGKDYHFINREQFLIKKEKGEFLEAAEVHGNLYGTLKESVQQAVQQGRWVLLDIDAQGYKQVRQTMPQVVSFFVRLPNIEAYEHRLRCRATESEQQLAQRLADVRLQLADAWMYDFQIVNETLDQAVRTFRTLLWGLYFLNEVHENDR